MLVAAGAVAGEAAAGAAVAGEAGAVAAGGAEAGAAAEGGLGKQLSGQAGGAQMPQMNDPASRMLNYGHSLIKGGYKELTGSEAMTGALETPGYLPYNFGGGAKPEKASYQSGRGFRKQAAPEEAAPAADRGWSVPVGEANPPAAWPKQTPSRWG